MFGLPIGEVEAKITSRSIATIIDFRSSMMSVFMDFIMGFPKTNGFGSIMVVIDRFSKYETFIPTIKECQ